MDTAICVYMLIGHPLRPVSMIAGGNKERYHEWEGGEGGSREVGGGGGCQLLTCCGCR